MQIWPEEFRRIKGKIISIPYLELKGNNQAIVEDEKNGKK